MLHIASGLLILVVVLVFFVRRHFSTKQEKLPPGPPGLPLIGNIHQISKDGAAKQFAEWAKIYGPLVSAKFGPDKMVVINSIEIFKEAFVTRGSEFAGRPDGFILRLYSPRRSGVVASDYGPEWKRRRRLAYSCMRMYGSDRGRLQRLVNSESQELVKRLENKSTELINLKVDLSLLVMNVLATVIFGITYNADDQEFLKIVNNISTFSELVGFLRTSATSPFLRLFYKSKIKQAKECVSSRDAMFGARLSQHVDSLDRSNARDFIDELLLNRGEDSIDLEQLRMILGDMQFAGYDTTVSTLLWGIVYLVLWPEKQEKLFNELRHELASGSEVVYEERSSLPYLEATIHEVLRKSSIGTFSLPHSATKAANLNGYNITTDVILLANIYAIHHDERHWKRPNDFEPERFITDTGAFAVPTISYVPFFGGPRSCIGEQVVKMELFVIFAHLFRNFKISVNDSDARPSLDGKQGVVYEPRPFSVRLEKR